MTKTCDSATIEANKTRCDHDRPGILYAPISVLISAVDTTQNLVCFYARDKNGNEIEVKDVSWTGHDLWVECPSTLDGDPRTLPRVGNAGVLYVSASVLSDYSLAGTPKWPNSLGTDRLSAVRIWPMKVEVFGREVETGDPQWGSIDLLDPDLCATLHNPDQCKPLGRPCAQSIVLDGSEQSLLLTDNGLQRFLLSPLTLASLRTAVETIEAKQDAFAIISAWKIVSRWQVKLEQVKSPEAEDAKARELLSRVLRPH